jgi:hypothetical protein
MTGGFSLLVLALREAQVVLSSSHKIRMKSIRIFYPVISQQPTKGGPLTVIRQNVIADHWVYKL